MRNSWETKTAGALACAAALSLSYVVACGGDGDGGVGVGNNGNSNGDSNNNSSGGDDEDAGGDASAAEDAGTDAGDASTLPQGTCELDPEQLTIKIDNQGSHSWDALLADDTIHLAFEVPACPDLPQARAQAIQYVTFASTGAFGDPQPIINFGADQCFYTRTPTLSVDGSGKAVIYHSATNSLTAELYQKTVGSDDTLRLTSDPDSVRDVEEHMAVTTFGPSDLLSFVNAVPTVGRPNAAVGQLVTMRPAQPLVVNEIVSADEQQHVDAVSLAAFASDNDLGGVIAWIADVVGEGATPAIYARLLNKKGEPAGKVTMLTEKVGGFSSVHLTMLPKGSDDKLAGAMIYGVALDDLHTEQRFRTIAKDGTFGPERKITTGERNATGGTLTPFAGGYVAAFRVIDGAITRIVLSFVDKTGQLPPEGERVFADADTNGGSPKVFVTSDGRFSVVFSNTNGDGTFIRAVRGTCDP